MKNLSFEKCDMEMSLNSQSLEIFGGGVIKHSL